MPAPYVPGLEPKIIKYVLDSGLVRALILESLGEGNVCSNLIPVIKYATSERSIPVFISSQFTGGSANATHYAVGIAAIAAGGIACGDHTASATDVKVRWLLGNNICPTLDSFRTAMRESFAGEVTRSQ